MSVAVEGEAAGRAAAPTGPASRPHSEGWRARTLRWRNRLFSDPRFQRWAADFPLTRPVAHARAQGLFDLVAGFVYAQTLSACVETGLLERLRGDPAAESALARDLRLPLEATSRLLGAARALRLVEPVGDERWTLGPQGAALLGSSGLMEMIRHHARLYTDLADAPGLLRRGAGGLAEYWPYATSAQPGEAGAEAVSGYSALMAATQPAVAADLLAAYPVRRHRRLLDVGGGEGAFLEAAGRAAPDLSLSLIDLPAVAGIARERLRRAGLESRATVHEGDFLHDPLPKGADLITLVRILHDHDDAGVDAILRACRAALPADGTLLIGEPMSGGERPERVGDVYFAFYLLAMGRGRARSPAELTERLHAAGFRRVKHPRTRTPSLLRAIAARP